MKNEMKVLTMRMSKEIEDWKKNAKNLGKSLKDRSEECIRLAHENDMLRTELVQTQNNEQELERMITLLKGDMDTTIEYKDKFKDSYAKLDELLKDQRHKGDTRGLGFEHGEIFSDTNEVEATN